MQYDDENAEKYGYEGEMTPLKCDELKAINAYQLTTNTEDSDVYIHNDEFGCGGDLVECYLKSEADTAIAELKEAWRSEHEACEALKAKLEDVQASAYADSVDAGMRERRLRRALWIARAERTLEKIAWFKLWNASISTMNPEDGSRQEFDKWKKNLGKFLKKAEEYK
jgi:hypothetical protein